MLRHEMFAVIEICWLRPNQIQIYKCKRSNYCRIQANFACSILSVRLVCLQQNRLIRFPSHLWPSFHQIESYWAVVVVFAMRWFFGTFFSTFSVVIDETFIQCIVLWLFVFFSFSHFHCLFCVLFLRQFWFVYMCISMCSFLFYLFVHIIKLAVWWRPSASVLSVLQLSNPTNIRKHCHDKSDKYDSTGNKIESYNLCPNHAMHNDAIFTCEIDQIQ